MDRLSICRHYKKMLH